MEGFGQRLLALRHEREWTRRELAKQAGLHEKHLLKVEGGERQRLEADTIIKLAKALGCSADYLLGLTDDPQARATSRQQRRRQAAPVA